MSFNKEQSKNTSLKVSNPEGLNAILNDTKQSIENIYATRKEMVDYFRKELFVAKTKHEAFKSWSMDDDGNVHIKEQQQQVNISNQNTPFVAVRSDPTYEYKEYNGSIRYAYKSVISNLMNAKKSIEYALKYNGEVDIPSDVLNNIDFFGNDPECKSKVHDYSQQRVDKFIKQRTGER